MEESPLQRLPAELRVHIWEYAVKHTQPIHLVMLGDIDDSFICKKRGYEKIPLDLTLTCRQISDESLPVFYKINSFFFSGPQVMQTSGPEYIIDDFREAIGEGSFAALRDVSIHIGRVFGQSFASGDQHENNLYDMLQPAVDLSSSVLRHCRVSACVNLMNMRASWHHVVFKLKLDVSNLKSSWESNLREFRAKKSKEKCYECRPLLNGLLEVMEGCRDRMNDTGKSFDDTVGFVKKVGLHDIAREV